MQGIVTRWYPASNTRPAYFKAWNSSKTHSVKVKEYPNGSHLEACKKLREILGWTKENGFTRMVSGSIDRDSCAWVFVFDNPSVTYYDGGADN